MNTPDEPTDESMKGAGKEHTGDPLKNALQEVNKVRELHQGPADKNIREANAAETDESTANDLDADDSGA